MDQVVSDFCLKLKVYEHKKMEREVREDVLRVTPTDANLETQMATGGLMLLLLEKW